MGKIVDLTGRVFERLTVVGPAEPKLNGQKRWTCICSCDGKITVKAGSDLVQGDSKSCGCLRREIMAERMREVQKGLWGQPSARRKDRRFEGRVFGRLTVLDEAERHTTGKQQWRCRCSCEAQTIVLAFTHRLERGATDNCGCLKSERMLQSRIENAQFSALEAAEVNTDDWEDFGGV